MGVRFVIGEPNIVLFTQKASKMCLQKQLPKPERFLPFQGVRTVGHWKKICCHKIRRRDVQ
jgi:hypothetical protein